MCEPTGSSARSPAIDRPRWGRLYAVVVPQLAALAIVELSGPPSVVRTTVRYAVALGTWVAMVAWVRANRAAIDLQDWCACAGRTVAVRVIESRRPASLPPPRLDRSPTPADEEYEPAHR